MKEVHSKDLVVGKVYADYNDEEHMTLLRYIGRGLHDDIFLYVGGENTYRRKIGNRIKFGVIHDFTYYEPTDEIMERFGLEHKMAKNKRVCN